MDIVKIICPDKLKVDLNVTVIRAYQFGFCSERKISWKESRNTDLHLSANLMMIIMVRA